MANFICSVYGSVAGSCKYGIGSRRGGGIFNLLGEYYLLRNFKLWR
jgi:hypothetical protein